MSQSLVLNVNPKVLHWARTEMSLSISEVADRLSLSDKDFIEIEKGEKQPTFKQIRELTQIFEVPIATFYLPNPPKDLELPPDYRSKGQILTKKSLLSFRRVSKVRESYLELQKSLGQESKPKSISFTQGTVIDNAQKVREFLGIDSKLQFSANNPETFFSSVQKKLESLDILVLEVSLPRSEFQGFSFSESPITIVVNHSDAYQAKLFTLAHELCHILTGTSSICSADPFLDSIKIEQICNKFAAKFLISEDDLISSIDDKKSIQDSEIRNLAEKFNVSKYVMLFRVHELQFINSDVKDNILLEWQKEDSEKSSFFRTGRPENKAIRENGQLYTSLVYQAYDKSLISYASIPRYLGINPSLVDKIGERLGA